MRFIPNIVTGIVILAVLASLTILGVYHVVNGEAILALFATIIGGGGVHAVVSSAASSAASSDAPSNVSGI